MNKLYSDINYLYSLVVDPYIEWDKNLIIENKGEYKANIWYHTHFKIKFKQFEINVERNFIPTDNDQLIELKKYIKTEIRKQKIKNIIKQNDRI